MLFQCGRLEGLHLPYVSLVRATGVGRLSGGGGVGVVGGVLTVYWGYVRQLNDGRTLPMERAMKVIDQDTQLSSFSSHKLFSALLLIRIRL